MSLRWRLILAVGLALALMLPAGFAVESFLAARQVSTEVGAAIAAGRASVAAQMANQAGKPANPAALMQIVHSFDGDRHLTAELIGESGAVVARSQSPPPALAAPSWFESLVSPRAKPARIALGPAPPEASPAPLLILRAEPHNEASEAWRSIQTEAAALAAFTALTILLVPWTLRRALTPLDALDKALQRLGAGDLDQRLPAAGPPQIARLAAAFNQMSARLAESMDINRRLQEQTARLLEEERAELARDLHDEIGPLLFAMKIDLAALQQTADGTGNASLSAQLHSVTDGVKAIQATVRDQLARLRPIPALAFGLERAVQSLLAFWRLRYPDLDFHWTMDCAISLSEAEEEAFYRLVQEGLSNALRHGKPSRVEIIISQDADFIRASVDNDTGLGALPEQPGSQQGLFAMRERFAALSGAVTFGPRPGGWHVGAQVPRHRTIAPHAA
jgi:two-component system sensor histidine kinase UhpB